ncbi:MAG: OmpA family protein [Gammaproteobacteria bacterium]
MKAKHLLITALIALLTGCVTHENPLVIDPQTGSVVPQVSAANQTRKDSHHETADNLKDLLDKQFANSSVMIVEIDNSVKVVIPSDPIFKINDMHLLQKNPILHDLAAIMKQFPSADIKVEAFTDSYGNHAKNQALSQERAYAVAEYFMDAGLTSDHIQAVGYGSGHYITTNKTAKGRSSNRRIIVSITL